MHALGAGCIHGYIRVHGRFGGGAPGGTTIAVLHTWADCYLAPVGGAGAGTVTVGKRRVGCLVWKKAMCSNETSAVVV